MRSGIRCLVVAGCLLPVSCRRREPLQDSFGFKPPSVVEAKPYKVPLEKTAPSKIMCASNPKKIIAGKPEIIKLGSNVFPAKRANNNYLRTVILCLFLLFSFNQKSIAQNENLRFEHMGIEEGLSNENVTYIFQDSEGYMWFGTFDGLNKYDGYSFTKYQFDPFDSNSLSQNFIYTIWEDKYGAIWVSSFEGLCKFDKSTEKFSRYKPSANARFSDPNISAINEDSDGMIWVGSHSGGLCRFNRQTGKFLPEYFDLGYHRLPGDKAELNDNVNCIYKDRAGTLWVGNTTGLHKIILTAAKAGQPSSVTIKDYRYDPSNINTLSSNIVTSIIEDRIGIMWVATQNGLNSFDQKTGTFKRYLHDPNNIYSISSNNMQLWFGSHLKEDQEGNLWICTDNGLNKLNSDRTIFTAYFHNPGNAYSLSSNIVISLQIDKAGILWAGSWSGKLNKANLNYKDFGLERYEPNNLNSLSNNKVTSMLEDSSGIIWIGTFGGGLNRWDKKNNQFTHFRNNPSNHNTLKNDAVHAILEDRHGHLWVANGEVLSRLNKQTGEFTHYYAIERNYRDQDQRLIYSIAEDREGLLWLGTGNGLKSFDEKTGKFKHYYYSPADSNGISDFVAIAVFADSKDNIWVGYGSRATDRLNRLTGHITHYKHDAHDSTSISSNIVNCFYEDSKGNLWLGTRAGGLCKFDYQREKFTTFTTKHGLPSNSVYSILEDNKNHLWLGTVNGLSQFDPIAKTFTNYDYKDGLQSNVFAAGEERERGAHFKGKDGILYFGGVEGFNFFDPLKFKSNSTTAPIVITQFKLFDKLVKGAHESKEIILDYDKNYFSFEFSSLSFYNPGKNQYAYKLEGVDKDWVYSGSRRYAGYTNINPGTYTFRVKGTNNDGVWNEKGVSISIIINPPWWSTWWAYASYVLVFLVALIVFIKWRERILKREKILLEEKVMSRTHELQKEKEKVESSLEQVKALQAQLVETEKINERLRISQELHDDIGGTLSGIVLYSHLAENQIQAQHTDEVEQSLNKIQQSANDMVNKLSDIIWSVNPEHNSIKNLFQKLRQYATEMGGAKNIKVHVDSPEALAELYLPVNIRHNVYLLFKEAINNAVKYSKASLLQLNVQHSDHTVEFTMSDNGKGFDITTVKTGNGLMNMQKRADDIHAKFCLRSVPQKGTVISLRCSIEVPS